MEQNKNNKNNTTTTQLLGDGMKCPPQSMAAAGEGKQFPPQPATRKEAGHGISARDAKVKPRRNRPSGAEAKRRRRAREVAAAATSVAAPPSSTPTPKTGTLPEAGAGSSALNKGGLPATSAGKRPRQSTSLEETPRRMKKSCGGKQAAAPSKIFSEAALRHLKVAIIDETNPYGKVNDERESLIKKILLEELDKFIFSDSSSNKKAPTFKSWTYSGEIIRVVCGDDVSLEWLKDVTKTLKPWEGASLAVVSVDRLPKLTKASLWIPDGRECWVG